MLTSLNSCFREFHQGGAQSSRRAPCTGQYAKVDSTGKTSQVNQLCRTASLQLLGRTISVCACPMFCHIQMHRILTMPSSIHVQSPAIITNLRLVNRALHVEQKLTDISPSSLSCTAFPRGGSCLAGGQPQRAAHIRPRKAYSVPPIEHTSLVAYATRQMCPPCGRASKHIRWSTTCSLQTP